MTAPRSFSQKGVVLDLRLLRFHMMCRRHPERLDECAADAVHIHLVRLEPNSMKVSARR